ncbi:MAG: hypothetical protein QW318_08305 [Candidatus Caldarchaeum sp.]|uniref:Uncharacterized protein n=1 Tax=Caldiarchaeum subterraneum TaxID=311458 RepID=A0A7J3G6U2_CALS0
MEPVSIFGDVVRNIRKHYSSPVSANRARSLSIKAPPRRLDRVSPWKRHHASPMDKMAPRASLAEHLNNL